MNPRQRFGHLGDVVMFARAALLARFEEVLTMHSGVKPRRVGSSKARENFAICAPISRRPNVNFAHQKLAVSPRLRGMSARSGPPLRSRSGIRHFTL